MHRGKWVSGTCGTNVVFEDDSSDYLLSPECGQRGVFTIYGAQRKDRHVVVNDDITGQVLQADLVRAARKKDLQSV